MKNLTIIILTIIGFAVGIITTVFAISILMGTTTIVSNGINLRGYRLASVFCACGLLTSFICIWQMFHALANLKEV